MARPILRQGQGRGRGYDELGQQKYFFCTGCQPCRDRCGLPVLRQQLPDNGNYNHVYFLQRELRRRGHTRQRIRVSPEQSIVTNGNQYDRPCEQRQLRSCREKVQAMRKRFQFALFVFLSVLFLPSMAFADGQRTGACPTSNLGAGVTCVQYGLYDSYPGAAQSSVTLNFTPTNHSNGFVVGGYFCYDTTCSTSGTATASLSDNINPVVETCFATSPHTPFINGNQPLYMWYCPALPSGVTSITMKCSAAYACTFMSFWVAELSGMCNTAPCWDVDAFGQALPVNSVTLSTPTTNHTNELIVALFQNNNDEAFSAISPTIVLQSSSSLSSFPGNMLAGKTSTSTGVYSLTGSWAGPTDKGYGTIGTIKTLQSVSLGTSVSPPLGLTATVQ
jgi:hypothetical protein